MGVYLIDLQASGTDIDFYIFPFLNFYLIWNTGIVFGLASMETNVYYHILTTIIVFINIGLIFFLVKSKGVYAYLISFVIGCVHDGCISLRGNKTKFLEDNFLCGTDKLILL